MQTLGTLVKQFNVNLKLTKVMATREIKCEFTDYHVDKEEEVEYNMFFREPY